jgi:hypothetical protein
VTTVEFVTELDVAFAGVVSAGLVGVLAPVMAWLVARANQQHERKLARDERVYARRSVVYEDLIAYLQRSMLVIHRTHPIIGPQPPPPEPPGEEELIRLQARVAAFGSEDVVDRLAESTRRRTSFHAHAFAYEQMRAHARDTMQSRLDMDEARERAGQQLMEIERRVRDELTQP